MEMTTKASNEAKLALEHYKFVVEYGGQSSEYWEELSNLYFDHGDAVRACIDAAADALKEESSSSEATASSAYEQTIELKAWLKNGRENEESTAPSEEKLRCPFYSYALIALTQTANYLAFLRKNALNHEEIVRHTVATIGLSQGVVSAVVFSAAKDQDEFVKLSVHVIRYMFWQGLRAQETFNEACKQLGEHIDESDGTTPMLAVKGLDKTQVLEAIEVTLRKTNCNDVELSLINGRDIFCVTGLPSTLQIVRQELAEMMATSDDDHGDNRQSTPKPSRFTDFVDVTCAFHSTLLASAKPRIISDISRIELSICGSNLQIPVYSTTSDSLNLPERGETNILDELVSMQLVDLADWTATWRQVTSKHRDATHLLDFGPDIGPSMLSSAEAEDLGLAVVLNSVRHASMKMLE